MNKQATVTALLIQLGRGTPGAMEELMPLVYSELKSMAHGQRRGWRDQRSPGTTSLVHEAYLKLVDQTQIEWQNRAQFFYIASRAMRSVLIDNARRAMRQKREGERRAIPLSDAYLVSQERGDELLALDSALSHLEGVDERLARIVECRFFGGLSVEETAESLSVSVATVKRGWNLARGWLYRELSKDGLAPDANGAAGR